MLYVDEPFLSAELGYRREVLTGRDRAGHTPLRGRALSRRAVRRRRTARVHRAPLLG